MFWRYVDMKLVPPKDHVDLLRNVPIITWLAAEEVGFTSVAMGSSWNFMG